LYCFPAKYKRELQCISEKTRIPYGYLLLMQFIYEMEAGCTSVLYHHDQTIDLIRTMDWDMNFLKDITVNLKVVRGNEYIGQCTTWVGYVGFLTGMTKQWAWAINFRVSQTSDSLWNRLFRLIWNYDWPIGYLGRHLMETDTSFNDALYQFKHTQIVAPCYVTITDCKQNGFILSRNFNSCVHVKQLQVEDDNDKSIIFQTNINQHNVDDTGEPNILWSKERTKVMNDLICNDLPRDGKFIQTNWFELYPLKNDETIYSTFINCCENELCTFIYE